MISSAGHQNTRAPLTAIAAGSFVHLALDTLFIMGFHWDLMGAALAVVVSQYIASLSLCKPSPLALALRE